MLYKVEGRKISTVSQTSFPREDITEGKLEEWIENNPEILGEPILIIGRQVQIADVKDKLDLLGIDPKGNLVAIELKRDNVGGDADFQALRYVSYLSRWNHDTIEKQAKHYFENNKKETDFNFIEKMEKFCEKEYELNQDQRIILVGKNIDEKIGSVALWLLDHSVEIKVVSLSPYKDSETLYLIPQIIIPPPTTEKYEVGKTSIRKDTPWREDGKKWHLENRCGGEISQKLLAINEIISALPNIEGPRWNQKLYVSFYIGTTMWIYIETKKSQLTMWIKSDLLDIRPDDIANKLGIKILNKDATLSEKFAIPSALRTDQEGWLCLIIKEDFDEKKPEFKKFLENCAKPYSA